MPATSDAHPLHLALDLVGRRHRQPLVGGARLRHQRVDAGDDPADAAARARVLQHDLVQLQRQIANRHQIGVVLGRQADHVIELQALDAAREDQLGAIEDLFVGDRLVDDAAQPIGAGLGRNRQRALAALLEQRHDRRRQVVQAQRGRADRVAHVLEAAQDVLDVRVIAERDRHQAGARRMRARGLRQIAGCARSGTRGPAGSCSRPSRTGRGWRSRARLRSRKREPNSVSGVKMVVDGGSTASVVLSAAFFTTGGAPVPSRGTNRAMVPSAAYSTS